APRTMHLIAQVFDHLPAHRLCSLAEQVVVEPDAVRILRAYVNAALHALEERLHVPGPDVIDAVLAPPAIEDALGRAPGHASVDDGRAADGAAFLVEHGRPAQGHGGPAVAI